jgi:RHS repeat-associated protein
VTYDVWAITTGTARQIDEHRLERRDMRTKGRRPTAMRRLACSLALVALLWPAVAGAQGGDEVVYYHTDAIGSVRMTTDAGGAVIARYDFRPFGEAWNPPSTPDPRQFAGKERDAETGLDYFGARYYASTTGRFTTVDPVLDLQKAALDPQRWNRYAYALNNPLRNVDPDGKEPVTIGLAIWGLYEVGSTLYDAYTAYRTLNDPNASATERSVTTGGLLAGIILPGGGYGTAGKAVLRNADGIADAVAIVSRTPTDRLIQHLTRDDLVGAAREVVTGVQHGGQHLKEVREAARGLRERIKDLNQGLSNPRLMRQRRLELERELGVASRHLDAAEQALRGRYRQHDIP